MRTAERLVEAFRLLPGRGISSPVKADFRDLAGRRLEGLAIIACAQNCLGRQSLECQQLLTWGRVKATAGERWDESISEICREFKRRLRHDWTRAAENLVLGCVAGLDLAKPSSGSAVSSGVQS